MPQNVNKKYNRVRMAIYRDDNGSFKKKHQKKEVK
jgi:hypothetical protein